MAGNAPDLDVMRRIDEWLRLEKYTPTKIELQSLAEKDNYMKRYYGWAVVGYSILSCILVNPVTLRQKPNPILRLTGALGMVGIMAATSTYIAKRYASLNCIESIINIEDASSELKKEALKIVREHHPAGEMFVRKVMSPHLYDPKWLIEAHNQKKA